MKLRGARRAARAPAVCARCGRINLTCIALSLVSGFLYLYVCVFFCIFSIYSFFFFCLLLSFVLQCAEEKLAKFLSRSVVRFVLYAVICGAAFENSTF
jgi:hypothetical protein